MPRERRGPDYTGLPLAKPGAKRREQEGRTQFNSTLKSYSTLRARSPLKAVGANEERREAVDGEQSEACRMLPCCLCGADAPSDPMHTPPRTQGGLDYDTIPGCRDCHNRLDSMRHSRFWRREGIDPADLKQAVRDWMNAGYPQGLKPWGK